MHEIHRINIEIHVEIKVGIHCLYTKSVLNIAIHNRNTEIRVENSYVFRISNEFRLYFQRECQYLVRGYYVYSGFRGFTYLAI